MRSLVTPVPHRLELVERQSVGSVQDALLALEKALADDREGIMIKNLESPYGLGERHDAWIKLKPDYLDSAATLDLVVLGAYFGNGRARSETFGSLLLGCVDETSLADPQHPKKYYPIAKVGSGFSLEARRELWDKWKPIMVWPRAPPHACVPCRLSDSGSCASVCEAQVEFDRKKYYAHLKDWVPGKNDDVPDLIFPLAKYGVRVCHGVLQCVAMSRP